MRKIKFRAWEIPSKRMIPFEDFDRLLRNPSIIPTRLFLGEDIIKVMQFIELKDKNGKEIYEGDILTTTRNVIWAGRKLPKVWEVFYNNKELQFQGKNKDSPIHEHIYNDVEIIGNIYENPDLLTFPKEKEHNNSSKKDYYEERNRTLLSKIESLEKRNKDFIVSF